MLSPWQRDSPSTLTKCCLIFNSSQEAPPPREAFLDPLPSPGLDWLSILATSCYHSTVFASCICISFLPNRLWAHWKWTTMPNTEQALNKSSWNARSDKYELGRGRNQHWWCFKCGWLGRPLSSLPNFYKCLPYIYVWMYLYVCIMCVYYMCIFVYVCISFIRNQGV